MALIISAFTACALVSQASAQMMGRDMGPDMMGWGGWSMGWIFMIIFWGLIL